MIGTKSRWKLSVIDVLFILIIFFVVILSHSTLDVGKVRLFTSRIGEILGNKGIVGYEKSALSPPMVKPLYPGRKRVVKKVKKSLEILKEKYPFVKNFKVVELEESVKLLLPQRVTFRLGSYHLSSEALSLLRGICDALKDPSIEKIVVKGHTDNLQGVDNWVLSAKRAEVVLNFLIKECKLQKTKLELMACADTEPIASNETPLGRSKNRRVEIEIRFKEEQVAAREEKEK
ncbi:MAG: hypothetical protein DSY35_03690 [Desulfurobacterium sp.]|nr:MAG: hypothetical protein DSY35_03690 [Desulfurobacterium sp.]